MRVRAGIAAVVALLASGAVPGHAQAPGNQTTAGCLTRQSGGYACPWGFVQTLPGEGGARAAGSGVADAKPQKTVYVDRVGTSPTGEPCLRRTGVVVPEGSVLQGGTDFGNASGSLFSDYPRCPAEPGEEEVIDPRVIAMQGWEEVQLPKPEPYIAPGWAITGKYAYLETRGQLRHVFTQGTPIGPLEITSTGRYFVDWGDGEKTGPYSTEGGPWPDGTITHTYIHVGHYDVVVTEEWTATWRLGPASGNLSGQRTVGRIDDFRVEQIQVVVGP